MNKQTYRCAMSQISAEKQEILMKARSMEAQKAQNTGDGIPQAELVPQTAEPRRRHSFFLTAVSIAACTAVVTGFVFLIHHLGDVQRGADDGRSAQMSETVTETQTGALQASQESETTAVADSSAVDDPELTTALSRAHSTDTKTGSTQTVTQTAVQTGTTSFTGHAETPGTTAADTGTKHTEQTPSTQTTAQSETKTLTDTPAEDAVQRNLEKFFEMSDERCTAQLKSYGRLTNRLMVSVSNRRLKALIAELEPQKAAIGGNADRFRIAFFDLLIEKLHLTGIYDQFDPEYRNACWLNPDWKASDPFAADALASYGYTQFVLPFPDEWFSGQGTHVFRFGGEQIAVSREEVILRTAYASYKAGTPGGVYVYCEADPPERNCYLQEEAERVNALPFYALGRDISAYSIGDANMDGTVDESDGILIREEYDYYTLRKKGHILNEDQLRLADFCQPIRNVETTDPVTGSDYNGVMAYGVYRSHGGDMTSDAFRKLWGAGKIRWDQVTPDAALSLEPVAGGYAFGIVDSRRENGEPVFRTDGRGELLLVDYYSFDPEQEYEEYAYRYVYLKQAPAYECQFSDAERGQMTVYCLGITADRFAILRDSSGELFAIDAPELFNFDNETWTWSVK